MLATHLDAEKRYDEIRKITIDAAQRRLLQRSDYADIKLSTFDNQSLLASKAWNLSSKSRLGLDRWLFIFSI